MDESIEAVMEMRNQDIILMKNEGILSQKGNQMSLINIIDQNQVQENVNEDDGTRITLGEELQRDNKAKCTKQEETMLAENIVKDHQFTMMIGTVEIAMKAVETVSEEEEHLLKDVKEEEVYGKDLAKGKGTLKKECYIEEEQSLEVVRSMKKYLLEDKNSEIKEDEECLLNERNSGLLQQKELNNAWMCEDVTTQEQVLVEEGDEVQSEELICEATFETVEPYDSQTNNLRVNAENISDDKILEKCHREIALLENSEYDSMIAEKGVHYSGQEQEGIIRTDGVEERLMDSLMNSFASSNQHTNVLTEEKKTVQQTELLPKENKAQQPYVFNFNKCFVNAGFVAIAGAYLAQVNSQIKVKEEKSMEELNPWNREVNLLEKVLNNHDSIMK